MEQTMNLYLWYDGEGNDLIDSHHPHFSETPVFAGCGVRAVGTNESNTYRRTEREKTIFGVLMNMIYRIGHQADGRWGQGAGDAACLRRECAIRD